MKVLMIDSLVGNDYALIICSALERIGVKITLVTVENRLIQKKYSIPVKHWAPSKDPALGKLYKTLKYIQYLIRVVLYVLKTDTRLIHFQFLRRQKIESLFLVFLKILGCKIVYTAHNILPHENTRLDYFSNYIIYKFSDAIIVHSAYIKKRLMEHFGVYNGKIGIIPHGNFDSYLPETPVSQSISREKFDLRDDDNVLLFFGFIRDYKGLDLLLDAFEIAFEKDRRLKMLVAGKIQSDELKAVYRKQIGQMKSKSRIFFHMDFVPIEEVPFYFEAADIVALPYKRIDHSGILHLAYSFGRPVITTRVGDFAEILSQDGTGYVLEENNSGSMARSICEAFSEKKRLQDMGKKARMLSKTKYSWDHIAQDTSRVYQSILGDERLSIPR